MNMAETISLEEFHAVTRCLVGMQVSHAWRGYGSAIFCEFGELRQSEAKNLKGEATVMLEWSWRVEKQRSVFFGSFSGERKIGNGLQALVGRKIVDVVVEGRLPELVISLSGQVWVHSFTTVEGHPEWTLFLPDRNCVSSRLGRIEREPCGGKNKK
ncbi:MAG: hypothetical protein ACR2GW_03910 [Pyrinomonadaceae bacterium]|jgi:hypothetical protein|nr:hypothetical protein [Acidobacteriota bacterium]